MYIENIDSDKMTITFKDVAKYAGVSTQTVSRVTNGSDNVSESTRKKVNNAIKHLGYVPNKGAQMLSRAKSRVIGIVSLEISLHGVALITNGIRNQAHERNYATVLSMVHNNNIENVRCAIRELISQQAESIVINVPIEKQVAEDLVEQYRHLHLTFIDVPENTSANYVCSNNRQGAEIAAQHLIDSKRKKFLLITGPKESAASQSRHRGWLNILNNNQAETIAQYEGNWESDSGYYAVRDALNRQYEFDAVLVASDQMALGVLWALNELQIKVPDHVAVMGFDGTHDSAFFSPPLSTIKQDFEEIGRQAVNLALETSNDNQNSKNKIIPIELKIRQSTGIKPFQELNKKAIIDHLNSIRALLY